MLIQNQRFALPVGAGAATASSEAARLAKGFVPSSVRAKPTAKVTKPTKPRALKAAFTCQI